MRSSSAFTFRLTEDRRADGMPSQDIKVVDFEIRPLSYDDLLKVKSDKNIEMQLVLEKAKIIDKYGLEVDGTATITSTVLSRFTSQVIGLVPGGWLPSWLAANKDNAVILIDRNIISAIVSRFSNKKSSNAKKDFFDLFENAPIKINPILCVLEGNTKAIPTPLELEQQIVEITTKIAKALPKAEIIMGGDSLTGLLWLIEERRAQMDRQQLFLLVIAPKLSAPVAVAMRQKRWEEVLSAADEYGVAPESLVVLAALSVVVDPNGKGICKRLLNLKQRYSMGDAYNALCDLHSLEIMIKLMATAPGQPFQLCTFDRNMALFWSGLRVSNSHLENGILKYYIDPVRELMPNEYVGCYRDYLSRH